VTSLTRWRMVAVVGVAAGILTPLVAVYRAHARAARALAEHDAAAVAAYLAVVTPGDRRDRRPGVRGGGLSGAGADYSLPQLLIRAHALDGLPGMSGRFEVYHATAPLIRATALPLAAATLERLRRGVSVHWIDDASVGLAPLLDREGWDVVGAVAARGDIGAWLLSPWLIAPLVLVLVAAAQALRALGGAPELERQTLRQYGAAAALFAVAAFAGLRVAAAGATDQWLADVRLLMQDAAARVPELRTAPLGLAGVARGAEIVPAESGSPEPRRRTVGGVVRATVSVRLGPGRWVEVQSPPGEGGTVAWLPLLVAVAALGPLGVGLGVWANRVGPRRRRETVAAWTFLAPSALHLAAFSAVPLLLVPYLSVHRWTLAEPMHPFVGLANYARVLGSPIVWSTLGHTALYACSVPVSLALALVLALLLGREERPWALPALLFPYLVSVVVAALVWEQLYRPAGVVDRVMARVGLPAVSWLGEPRAALVVVLAIAVWMQLGYQVTLFRAGLRNVPAAYLEAAVVDGAGAWQRFRRITLPLLRPVMVFALVTGLVSAFQVFPLIVVLTGGGPRHATDVIAYHIYRTAWERLQFGEASAEALLLFAVLLVVTWVQFRWLDRRVEHA
jgi:ABC-type sugar transport system permease subunit